MRREEPDCMGNRLYFELVPKNLMGKAPRTLMRKKEWESISAHVFKRAGYKCEICGSKSRLQAHERYGVCGNTLVLLRIMCVCASCHLVTHIGFAHVIGKQNQAFKRYSRLNNLSLSDALIDFEDAMKEWSKKDNIVNLDWSMIASPPYAGMISSMSQKKAGKSFHDCGKALEYECECMLPLAHFSWRENVQIFSYNG